MAHTQMGAVQGQGSENPVGKKATVFLPRHSFNDDFRQSEAVIAVDGPLAGTVFQVGFRRSVIDSIALGFSTASIVVFVVLLVKV